MDREKIKLLHSRYNPQAEADRYVNSLSLDDKIRYFILIEPGIGYMIASLKKRVPEAKIITLHAGELRANAPPEWHPGGGISVQEFLENEIPDSEASEIKMLEWRPAISVYGQAYLSLVEETIAFIKRIDANTRTTRVFGRRWFRNFIRNTGIIQKTFYPEPFSLPLVITGAGPCLEDTIPLIQKETEKATVFILAASSSVMTLENKKLFPDMVISTDGGNWAALHLYECFRGGSLAESGKTLPYPIAISMTAALPSQCGTLPLLPISDGSLWQTLILKELNIPYITLPQRGTVSATAMDLAFLLTSGKIFIAGMDLANYDMRSHARPYSFDRLMEEKEQRMNPVYSQTFRRSFLLKAGGSYAIYASWFERQLMSYPKRLYSLGKNNVLFDSLNASPCAMAHCRDKNTGINFRIVSQNTGTGAPQKAISLLKKALEDPALPSQFSAKLYEELTALLLPGRQRVSRNDLIEAIQSSTIRNGS